MCLLRCVVSVCVSVCSYVHLMRSTEYRPRNSILGYVCEHGLGEASYAIRLRSVRKSEEKSVWVCVSAFQPIEGRLVCFGNLQHPEIKLAGVRG